MIDTVEDAHSPVGPSSGERIINCVGSVVASRGVKQGRSSVFAAEGTAAHTLSEWARTEGRPCKDFIGRTIEVDGYTFKVDDEMAFHVQEFVDWCEKEPGDRFVEIQVRYSEFVKGGYGRLDDARGRDGVVVITDLKYGKGKQVFVENNTQLRMYALGFYLTYGHLYDITGFLLRISQPRLGYAGEELISVEQLLEWAKRVLLPVDAKIQAGTLEFNAGSWCQYCPIRMSCETRQQWILEQVPTFSRVDPATEFEDLDAQIAEVVNDPPVFSADMDPERLRMFLQAAKPVIKFFQDIQQYAMSLFQAGQSARLDDYWKMVASKNIRVYTVPDEAVARELRSRGLDESDIWEPRKLRSPAQIEKRVGKKSDFMKSFVESKPGRPTIAPIGDRRKALQREQVKFDDLGDEPEEEN